MSLYAVVVGEPMREECVGDPKGTYMHTLKERYALADQCGSRTLGFKPLILEHAGGELTPGTEHFPVCTHNPGLLCVCGG